jgi:hypothetical protein
VFRSDSPGNIVEIARSGDPGLSAVEFVAPSVNDDGLVAFRGVDSSARESIFVADDTDLRRVIGRGSFTSVDEWRATASGKSWRRISTNKAFSKKKRSKPWCRFWMS